MGKCGASTQSIGDIKNSGTRHKIGSRNARIEKPNQGRSNMVPRSVRCPVKLHCEILVGLAPASVFINQISGRIKMRSSLVDR